MRPSTRGTRNPLASSSRSTASRGTARLIMATDAYGIAASKVAARRGVRAQRGQLRAQPARRRPRRPLTAPRLPRPADAPDGAVRLETDDGIAHERHASRLEIGDERVDERRHAGLRGEEHRGGRVGHGGPLGSAGLDERGSAAADRCVELRHRRGEAEVVGVAGVDPADQRVDQSLERLVAETGAHHRADGDVLGRSGERRREVLPDAPGTLGGQDLGRRRARRGRWARRGAGPPGAGGARRGSTPGRGERPATRGRPPARARGRARTPSGTRARKLSAASSRTAPSNGARRAPCRRAGPVRHGDGRAGERRVTSGDQAGDAAAGHDDVRHGAASSTRSASAPSTVGSALRTCVRAKASPTSSATWRASMSRSYTTSR